MVRVREAPLGRGHPQAAAPQGRAPRLGAAPLAADPARWRRYLLDALVETTLSRDVLLLTRVDKPALLRRLFELGCRYSGQVLSYTKMLGQLQDAGNTTTLANHLELLAAAGILVGLFYWRDRNREVDFVVRAGRQLTAIEVKGGRARQAFPGMEAFASAFRPNRQLLVGGDGIPLEEFLTRPVEHWVRG